MDYEIRDDGAIIRDRTLRVRGRRLQTGETAPDFALIANNWSSKSLKDYAGKVKVISVVPSLDTSVCDAQTRHFNQEAAGLSENIVILTVSADLPYAQRRWCGAAGIDRVETLSTHQDMKFADDYGVHIMDRRITIRAVFVLDADNKLVYVEYQGEIVNPVNLEAALEAAKAALQA